MRSTFLGLEMGRRAVMAQQAALDVTGHNIANANTPGYTRQVAEMATTAPYTYPAKNMPASAGQVGTGAVVADIRRLRDEFVDAQIRGETQRQGYWEIIERNMSTIEVIVNEPTDEGLRGVLDEYWKAWQAVSESPENESVRTALYEQAKTVAETFVHMYTQLNDARNDLNDTVKVKVDKINSIGSQLANLNQQIRAITVSGQRPNDLMDKRDLLIEELSKIASVEVKDNGDNTVAVTVGGGVLVSGHSQNFIGVVRGSEGMYEVVWDTNRRSDTASSVITNPTGSEVGVTLGQCELTALLECRGGNDWPAVKSTDTKSVTYMIDRLNAMARNLIEETNAIHKEGYTLNSDTPGGTTGVLFFDNEPADGDYDAADASGTLWCKEIKVNELLVDAKNIAAASSPTFDADGNRINDGDGSNALKIAQIKQTQTMDGVTMDDYWRGVVAAVGVNTEKAMLMVDNQTTLITQLEDKRLSVSGVSLDEEMTNMIVYQHAYNAAARFMTATDEALDKIINGMGLVGR